jgi:hypothetical protein
MTLPSQFLIRRNNDLISEEVFAFVSCKKGDDEKYLFDIHPVLPGSFTQKSKYSYEDLIKNTKYSLMASRYSKEKNKVLTYNTEFWYEGYVVNMNSIEIPIINMFKACQILPGKFVYIEKPIFSEYAVRIQNISVKYDIDKYLETHPGELCPILLIPIEKKNMCLTPCGHGVIHSAMLSWLQQKNQCPVCREVCFASSLILPKNI